MQKSELSFIIQGKSKVTGKFINMCNVGCGLRQKNFHNAHRQAQGLCNMFSEYTECRLILKYLPIKPNQNEIQLQFNI